MGKPRPKMKAVLPAGSAVCAALARQNKRSRLRGEFEYLIDLIEQVVKMDKDDPEARSRFLGGGDWPAKSINHVGACALAQIEALARENGYLQLVRCAQQTHVGYEKYLEGLYSAVAEID